MLFILLNDDVPLFKEGCLYGVDPAREHLLFICVKKSHPSGIKLFWFESLALGLCRTNNNGTCSLGPAGA